ncbi:MAG TPA: DUF5947 family protein [Nocardioidaceae bacterium]|nr:DUF5947 family protein [Nocardioidaceae bacterium]
MSETVQNPDTISVLRRIRGTKPTIAAGERCEMCAEPIAEEHTHVVDLEQRGLMCACRACSLLFTDPEAAQRYRTVPDRYLAFPGFTLDRADWEHLQIPVGLVFCFRNSVQNRMVAFYPSPAGATESELDLSAWDRITAANPRLETLQADVEALLVRADHPEQGSFSCHLVPIDACYELVGRMRATWRGFDGGAEARAAMAEFFAAVEARSR